MKKGHVVLQGSGYGHFLRRSRITSSFFADAIHVLDLFLYSCAVEAVQTTMTPPRFAIYISTDPSVRPVEIIGYVRDPFLLIPPCIQYKLVDRGGVISNAQSISLVFSFHFLIIS
jgi:hypothetical protein